MAGQDNRTSEEKARGQRHIDEALRRQHEAAASRPNPFKAAPTDTAHDRRDDFRRPTGEGTDRRE